jgi:signal transduction histidine kinase
MRSGLKMKSAAKPVTLLRYWTWLYVIVLLGSLLLIAVIAGLWVRHNAYDRAFQLLEFRTNQVADLYQEVQNWQVQPERLKGSKSLHLERYVIQLHEISGQEQAFFKGKNPSIPHFLHTKPTPLSDVAKGQTIDEDLEQDGVRWFRVTAPLMQNGVVTAALSLSLPADEAMPAVNQDYGAVAVLIGGVALAGWLVIYFLSRKLTRPLRQIAEASRIIADGGYDLELPEQEAVREIELQQLIGSFREMAERLQRLEQLRTGLLAGVSHELRTPITSIRGMIQAVQSQVVTDAEADEFLQISLEESKRLQAMVDELLHFSSLEAGATPIAKDTVNVSALVDEVIQQLGVLPQFDKIDFQRDMPATPLQTSGDAGALKQILINLMNNSQNAQATILRIRLQEQDGHLLLDVEDNGTGIPPEDQLFIFERFYRGHKKQKKKGGLGLGLTLSRLLARSHGGDLVLVQSSSEGTTFRLSLPMPEQQ